MAGIHLAKAKVEPGLEQELIYSNCCGSSDLRQSGEVIIQSRPTRRSQMKALESLTEKCFLAFQLSGAEDLQL